MTQDSGSQARATVQVDNGRVRVTEWRFAPGQSTGHHVHGHDYVVVPVTDGRLRLIAPGGETFGDLVAGQAYSRSRGVEHEVLNASEHEVVFVEIELLDAASGESPAE